MMSGLVWCIMLPASYFLSFSCLYSLFCCCRKSRQHILVPHINKKTGNFIVSNYEDFCNFIHIGVCYVVGAEPLQQQDDK